MVANRTRERRPSGMTRGAYGDVDYGKGQTGTYRGNAETAKPLPKVARAVLLSRPHLLGGFDQSADSTMRWMRSVSGSQPSA